MMPANYKFTVIGIDDNPLSVERNLNWVGKEIQSARAFSGGKRHHTLVKGFLPDNYLWIDITVPLEGVFAEYEKAFAEGVGEMGIVVFASGDPLFFGFANTLKRRLPEAEIKVFPVFNSLQSLSHKLAMRYDDMEMISLTGRPWYEFDKALIERQGKIGILTDKVHTPAAIARRALDYGFCNYRMYIGEALGGERERISDLSLNEAAQGCYDMPNCVIMVRWDGKGIYEEKHTRYFGIPHKEFELLDGRENMITKMPVRLLSLSMLDLYNRTVLWDIGFCTGSVSVEAKMQFPHLHIDAFEIREQCGKIIDDNCRKLGVPGIRWKIGDFTSFDLHSLLQENEIKLPDAVFIGGHGGKIGRIMEMLSEIVKPGCIVVFNSVKDSSQFECAAVENGFLLKQKTEITIDNYNKITCCKVIKEK